MTTLPHPVPSRTAQNIAALYGHEDDTLVVLGRSIHTDGNMVS